MTKLKIPRNLVTDELWRRGSLRFLIRDYQRPIYDALWAAIRNEECLTYVVNVARRFGKTTVAAIVAVEYALQNPNSQIKFACKAQSQMSSIINPILAKILLTCPDDVKPSGSPRMGRPLRFGNGSEITFSGVDAGNAERLRGLSANLNIVDEAGSCTDLEYVVKSILLPQQITEGGTLLALSTPSPAVDHFYTKMAREAEAKGNYITFDVYANKSLTPRKIDVYMEESGGKDSTTWKREYLCQFVTDTDVVLFPEWTDEWLLPADFEPDELFQFYHKYVAMDIGVVDFTACLFGYYDFRQAALYILDEYTINGPTMTTDILARQIRQKEKDLFSGCKSPHIHSTDPVYRRIGDNSNLVLIHDLTSLHDLPFHATNKGLLHGMVNEVRMWIKGGRIRVHPRCKMLHGNLKFAYWNTERRSFAQSKDYGHFDHAAALIYLIRNVDEVSNPVPPLWNVDKNTSAVLQAGQTGAGVDYEALARSFRAKGQR